MQPIIFIPLYVRYFSISHSKARVCHPQSNGKIEMYYKSIKNECIRRQSFIDNTDVRKSIEEYVQYYNYERLHSALYYLTLYDYLRNNVSGKLEERRKEYWLANMLANN